MQALESKLFQPSLSATAADSLLKALRNSVSRASAGRQLIAGAAGMQDRISADVAKETDIEVREAAADVVEALDAAYRTSDLGKQLLALYARHAEQLVPHAWQDFRKNPLDARATAILASAEPNQVLAWLAKNGDSRDGLRLALLRIREVPSETWAARHLTKYSYQSYLNTAGDVFPAGSAASRTAGARVVGQTLLRHVWADQQSDAADLPKLAQVCMARRTVYLFTFRGTVSPADGIAAFKFDVAAWSAQGRRDVRPPYTSTYREYGGSAPGGLAPLPKLLLEQAHELAWVQHAMAAPDWAKPYTPKVYWNKIGFAHNPRAKADPRVLESTADRGPETPVPASRPKPSPARPLPKPPADAPTIVVLEPQLPVISTTALGDRAQLVCDRLEEDLARTGKLRVVNRGELDRLIQERKLSPGQNRPALSFDAMVRLKVDGDELVPHASLTLVDLSTGNPLGAWTMDWPAADPRIAEVVAEIPARLVKAGPTGTPRWKLRLAGVESNQTRMGPLGLRLDKLFIDALGQSGGIMLVQHLEAASAQEESLLLMLGFSRLAGGRQFAPQADATLELRIAESDAIGKAFDDVPIEVSFRLGRAGQASDKWTTAKGVVRDYDQLAKQAWQALTGQLDKADAGIGSKMLDDLASRRKQALVELKAADNVKPDLPHEQLVRAKLDRIEAALKLDPLCEPAAYQRVSCLMDLFGHDFTKYSGTREVHELLLAGARYNELFPQNSERNAGVQDCAWLAVRMTPLIRLWEGEQVAVTPELRVLLDAMKRMVELSTRGDLRRLSRGCPRFLPIVYRGMRQAGLSAQQRQAWINAVLASLDEQFKQLEKLKFGLDISRANVVFRYQWINLIAAEMAAEDDQPKRALELMALVRNQLGNPSAPAVDVSQRAEIVGIMRRVVIKLDDAAALADFDSWVKAKQTPVRPIWFGNIPGARYGVYDLNDHPFKPVEIMYAPGKNPNWPAPMSPLCQAGGYMYALAWKDGNPISFSHMRGTSGQGVSQELVRIPLDDAGRPKGGADPQAQAGRQGANLNWDTLEKLPQPTVKKYLQVLCAQFIDGKLFIGTKYSGILVLNVESKQWRVVDTSAGLPCWEVASMHPQEDGTLFCTGGNEPEEGSGSFYFTYAPKSGEIRVLQKSDEKAFVRPARLLLDVWKHDGKLHGLEPYCMLQDLLAKRPRITLRPKVSDYFCTRLGGKLYVSTDEVMMEIDPAGKVSSRTALKTHWILPGFYDHWLLTRMDVPPDNPAGRPMTGDGRYMWFTESGVLYDPQAGTWYGPLMSMQNVIWGYCVATSAGLWLGTDRGMQFIDREKFMAAARKAGRAVTSEEYVKRRDDAIARIPPVPQARELMALRKFAQAKDVLDPHLKAKPDDPHVILLAGMVNDSWGLNDIQAAKGYYARLEEMADPSVRFTGMYMRLHMEIHEKKWPDAAATVKLIRDTFPALSEDLDKEIADLSVKIDKAIHPGAAKSPAKGRKTG
jgi:hypothetical protein